MHVLAVVQESPFEAMGHDEDRRLGTPSVSTEAGEIRLVRVSLS